MPRTSRRYLVGDDRTPDSWRPALPLRDHEAVVGVERREAIAMRHARPRELRDELARLARTRRIEQARGVRERLVQVAPAPGAPFDHGLFAIVEEACPTPAPTASADAGVTPPAGQP